MTTHPTPPAPTSMGPDNDAAEVRKRRLTRLIMRLPRMTPYPPRPEPTTTETTP